MTTKAPASSSLKEYLKRYETNTEEEKKKKRKKKKTDAKAVLVVDEDPVWQKPVNLAEDDSADEEKPQIDEDIEVKRMKRLEQVRLRRPYNVLSEDGSGWISVSDAPKIPNSSDQNSDMSPPFKRRARYDTPSPESGRDSTNVSAPKQRKHHHTPSPEPERKISHSIGLDPDMSPPRRPYSQTMTDNNRTNSDIPNKPGRSPRRSHRSSPDLDLSPPRSRRRRYHTPSPEPETNPSSSVLNSGLPSPRRPRSSTDAKRKSNFEIPDMPDISPPRRARQSSPYLDVHRASQGIDLSPPRKSRKDFRRHESSEFSPRQSHQHSIEHEASSDLSPPRKSQKELSLKERPKTGLIAGKDIREDNAKSKKDEWLRFKEMDPAISGRGAEPVYRDKKKGVRISKDEFMKSQKGEEKPKEIKLEWGKGLAQKREAEERQIELELEKDKPFARTRDDPELDQMLKERVRWGDPMAHLVKKKHSEVVLPDLGDNEKMTESGFIVPQEIPNHSWIKRGLDAAPNRYGIKPGRHWDGVDRSNGFEKESFKRTNDKQATQREAYLWSVADM